jgi:CheY-like chemotaxis protein
MMDRATPFVLHVDDDEDILAISKLALEIVGGFSIVQCSSGFEAVDIARSRTPDFFLLDVMMPDIDGVETLRRLREIEACRDVPAVFMTAKCSSDDRERLMATGAEAVISKPFDPMTLSAEIIEIWETARKRRYAAE